MENNFVFFFFFDFTAVSPPPPCVIPWVCAVSSAVHFVIGYVWCGLVLRCFPAKIMLLLFASWYVFANSFIHLVVCLTTGPKPLPKRAVHIVRSRASSFRCEYPLLSLRSSSSFLRLLPRLPVTSIPPFIFPSITCRRRQFIRKMWPIQLAFRFAKLENKIELCMSQFKCKNILQ
jgi:hypothetical protein